MSDDDESPGWDAIDATLRRLYSDQAPRHVGYVPGLHFGSGLQGCSAYRAANHWHYVTYGLTELWSKEVDSDADVSGWGYEMTMRVVGTPDEPPGWPFDLLEKVARHTHSQAHPYLIGDRLDPGGPITGAADTALTAVAFTRDPELPSTQSSNGVFEFRQLVGITAAELAEMRNSSTDAVLDRLRAANRLLVTDTR
jgi:hypothetical protein